MTAVHFVCDICGQTYSTAAQCSKCELTHTKATRITMQRYLPATVDMTPYPVHIYTTMEDGTIVMYRRTKKCVAYILGDEDKEKTKLTSPCQGSQGFDPFRHYKPVCIAHQKFLPASADHAPYPIQIYTIMEDGAVVKYKRAKGDIHRL